MMTIILCFELVVKMVGDVCHQFNASKGKTGTALLWNQVDDWRANLGAPDLHLSGLLPDLLICQEKLDTRIFIWNLPGFKYWQRPYYYFFSKGLQTKTTCVLCPAPGQNFLSPLLSMVWYSPRHVSKDYCRGHQASLAVKEGCCCRSESNLSLLQMSPSGSNKGAG